MSTHNICFYGELTKTILQLSSNTPLICSTAAFSSQIHEGHIHSGHKTTCTRVDYEVMVLTFLTWDLIWLRAVYKVVVLEFLSGLSPWAVQLLCSSTVKEYPEIQHIWATAWQNQQNYLCVPQRLRSAWASTQSDLSSLSAWRNLGSLDTHWAHREDWSVWAYAQADLSLCWEHRSFCWFCRAAAHFINTDSSQKSFISFLGQSQFRFQLTCLLLFTLTVFFYVF